MRPTVVDSLGEWVIQLVVSTVGAILTAFVAALIVATLIAAAMPREAGYSLGDRIDKLPLLDFGWEPYFVLPVMVAFVLGIIGNRKFHWRLGAWVWVLPGLILAWNVFTWHSGTSQSDLKGAWLNSFTPECDSSECIYELFVTAPFYTSVAYSLGWIGSRLIAKKHSI